MAGVPVVIAEDMAPLTCQALAECVWPPEHGRHGAHDEKDRWLTRITEGLRREFDSVCPDHALVHRHLSFVSSSSSK
jgi:hypothetical protein